MNAQKLSFAFLFYGILLLAAAGFCYWVNHSGIAALLGISGFGIMFWAHFFNRRHFWGFQGLLAQLFLQTGLTGWLVLTNFNDQPVLTHGQFSISAFLFFSLVFGLTVGLLLVAVNTSVQVKRELQ